MPPENRESDSPNVLGSETSDKGQWSVETQPTSLETVAPTPSTPIHNDGSPLKQIRTFQGDVADALGRQNESLFSIQQAERVKMGESGILSQAEAAEAKKRKEFLLLFTGSVFLILLGGVGAWYGYKEFVRKSGPPTILAPESRFIASQSQTEIDAASTTRDTLLIRLSEGWSGTGVDEINHLILRQGNDSQDPLTTATQFLTILGTTAPGSLVRSFEPTFMLGSLGESRFLIFKLSSFENAFAGMLTWEKTLARDLGPLFVTDPLLKSIPPESVFKDVISRNKDVRVLYAPVASSTEPALLYSFFDRKALIITDSLETLRVLVDRLTQELLSR